MPFNIDPIACSRIPKWMMRPYGLAFFIALDSGRNESPPSIVVLLLSARSAEPPHISGSFCARALTTSPDALRVAISVPDSKVGMRESQSAGSSWESTLFRVLARSGSAFFHASNFVFHSFRNEAPRCFTRRE